MRALVMLLVALFVAWRLRRWLNRKVPPSRTSVVSPTTMVPCSHCGVHIPTGDALIGTQGQYCCADHRTAAEH